LAPDRPDSGARPRREDHRPDPRRRSATGSLSPQAMDRLHSDPGSQAQRRDPHQKLRGHELAACNRRRPAPSGRIGKRAGARAYGRWLIAAPRAPLLLVEFCLPARAMALPPPPLLYDSAEASANSSSRASLGLFVIRLFHPLFLQIVHLRYYRLRPSGGAPWLSA
jgi:hypothetical protein